MRDICGACRGFSKLCGTLPYAMLTLAVPFCRQQFALHDLSNKLTQLLTALLNVRSHGNLLNVGSYVMKLSGSLPARLSILKKNSHHKTMVMAPRCRSE